MVPGTMGLGPNGANFLLGGVALYGPSLCVELAYTSPFSEKEQQQQSTNYRPWTSFAYGCCQQTLKGGGDFAAVLHLLLLVVGFFQQLCRRGGGGGGGGGRKSDNGRLADVVVIIQRGAVPASGAELELALVDGPCGTSLDTVHKSGMFLAELDLFGVQRRGQLVADRWRAHHRWPHRTGPRQRPFISILLI